jgi:hypothetical protein
MTPTTEGGPPIDKWATRTHEIEVDLTEEEEAMLTAKAAKKGLTLEEYFRVCCGFPP